ncbi:DUF4318 domain-containing protein [Clostridium perfringens]|nr:DUF4318 domain-containing protein [Clostridium perfringens]
MTNIFKNMLKVSIDIPYEDFTVYPTISVTKNAISEYCAKENIEYEFLEDNEDGNMQVKLNNKDYEILRYLGGRGCYAIRCRPL